MKKCIGVIVSREQYYKDFLVPVHPVDHKKFRMINNIECIYGVNFSEVITVGPHPSNYVELYHNAMIRVVK